MRIKIQQYVISRKRNIQGQTVSISYEYIIVIKRWLRRKRYLHLLPGWTSSLYSDEPMRVELTNKRYATTFRDNIHGPHNLSVAKRIVMDIKTNPDKFIIE